MHITTSVREAGTDAAQQLRSYVGSDSHMLSVTGDIAADAALQSNQWVALTGGQSLHPIGDTSPGWNAKQQQHFNNSLIGFAGKNLGIVKKYFPETTGPIDGVEFVFASHAAIGAFADPERKSYVKPLIKSSRAIVELIDIAKLAIPGLQNNPYVEVAGVIVKVGDSMYSFYDDMQKIQTLA